MQPQPHMSVVAGVAPPRPVAPSRGAWPAVAPRDGDERIAAAFAAARRAAGARRSCRFSWAASRPSQASREIGEACIEAAPTCSSWGSRARDPHADGPVIREAGAAALRAGATVDGVLDVARALSRRVPVVIMCYAETVLARGARRFAADLRDAGVSGLVVPDLEPRELRRVLRACDARAIALVPLVAPATPDDRVAQIGGRGGGFVYAMSVSGSTGERSALPVDLAALIRRARAGGPTPVALGFGISTPEHAANAADAGADGVIVGSRLVRAAAESADPAAAVGELVAGFSRALARRVRRAEPALAAAA